MNDTRECRQQTYLPLRPWLVRYFNRISLALLLVLIPISSTSAQVTRVQPTITFAQQEITTPDGAKATVEVGRLKVPENRTTPTSNTIELAVARLKSPAAQPAAAQTTNPCGGTVYKQFDFWVGEWDVFAGGKQIGTNSVQKILGGCVVFENWTDMRGRGGKSFNTFNSQKGKWQQTWVDDNGNVIEFVGEAKDGVMTYHAETIANDGLKIQNRMTFTKILDNRVRQFWEQSRDAGRSWTVAFDGDYQRRQ